MNPIRRFSDHGRPFLLLGILVATVLALYGRHYDSPLDSDARFLTVQNAYVKSHGGLARFWTADFFDGAITNGVPYESGYYRPVTNTELWAEYRLAGESETAYRVTQTLLHAVNAFLIFLLVTQLFGDRRAAVLVAALFVVHPVHAFAATEPAARADVLFPLFYILAILTFDRALRSDRSAALVVTTCLLFCLTVLSKEMGITLPAVLVLVAGLRHFRDGIPLRRLGLTVPVWATMAVYLIWRFLILDINPPTVGYSESYSSLTLLLAGVKSLFIHTSRVVAPLGATYPELNPSLVNFLPIQGLDPVFVASVVMFVLLLVAGCLWKRMPEVAFLACFLVVTFSPLMRVDNIAGSLGNNAVLTQERWFYLPALSLFIAFGLGVSRLLKQASRSRDRLAVASLCFLVMIGLGYSAFVHAGRHNDPFSRLRRLYLFPEERLSRMELANKLMLYAQWVAVPTGELQEAEERARAAVDLMPDSPVSAVALANVLAQRSKWAEIVPIMEPWMNPSDAALRQYASTNRRVGDDLNRVSASIPFLLGTANGHLGLPDRSGEMLCVAVQRGFDVQTARVTWNDIFPGRELECEIVRIGV